MVTDRGGPLLEVDAVSAGYGRELVIQECSIRVAAGHVVLLMGRNGAGKTTLVSTISGRLKSRSGQIHFNGRPIDKMSAYQRARLGLSHVPQGREMIPSLTVEENLLLASGQSKLPDRIEPIFDNFPILRHRLRQASGSLSGGEQQMLAIARGLIREPQLLILDEPSMGLGPLIIEDLFGRLSDLVSNLGLTVLLVEQQISSIWHTGLVDYVYVLDRETVAMEGSPLDLSLEDLQRTYLGAPI